MLLEATKQNFNVLVDIDGDYYWMVTQAASKTSAINNAKAIVASRFANVSSVKLAIHKLSQTSNLKFMVDSEIKPELWNKAKPLRVNSTETKPSIDKPKTDDELVAKTERFMNKFYGKSASGVFDHEIDTAKIKQLALKNGFKEDEVNNTKFSATVNAYIYSRLK